MSGRNILSRKDIVLSPIFVAKLAHDAGFDLEIGEAGGWLAFGVPGQGIRAWVRAEGDGAVVALARPDLLRELEPGSEWHGVLPASAAGARLGATPDTAISILARARVLDRTLPQALLHEYQAAVATVDCTEAMAFVRQRRGQDLFRKGLMDYWQGRCAITGLDLPVLLRASHAKPWKDATDAERLDVHNGLLLVAHLDLAFDQGLITIGADGAVIVSPLIGTQARAVLGLASPLTAKNLKQGHEHYLAWHRTHVFHPERS